jgi:hypothetical protein
MHGIEMIDGAGGMRDLTDRQVAMVGDGDWGDAAFGVFFAVCCISPTFGGILPAAGMVARVDSR